MFVHDNSFSLFNIFKGNEVWNINQDGIDVLIDFKNTAKAKEFMAKSDFTYNIMINDLEVAIDDTYVEVNNTYPKMPWLDREGKSYIRLIIKKYILILIFLLKAP